MLPIGARKFAMLSRLARRNRSLALACAKVAQSRAYTAARSYSASDFVVSEAAGTKIVSRDGPSNISTLALVSKAGTRYQWLPGLAEVLEQFAFKNTQNRFAVRIVRESELLGSELFTRRTREAVLFGAKFLKEDLPFFVELLAEVASETKYQDYILHEVIQPVIHEAQKKFLSDPTALAINSVHSLAFHKGLGNPLYPATPTSYHIQAPEVEAYAAVAYSKPNFALVGSGVAQDELAKWTCEFFGSTVSTVPAGLPGLEDLATKYYGGEERIYFPKQNTIVIAFPASGLSNGTGHKPEFELLATLFGGSPSMKWSASNSLLAKAIASHKGVSVNTDLIKYSDTGLLTITLTGQTKTISAAAKDVISTLKTLSRGQISKEDLKKATVQAKFKCSNAETAEAPALDLIGLSAITSGKVLTAEESLKGISVVTEAVVQQTAKNLLSGRACMATIGELQELPFAEDIGLTV